MPQNVIIRLHPAEPVSGGVFATYLAGLTVTLFDQTFGGEDGPLATEAYAAQPSASRIVQHARVLANPSPGLVTTDAADATPMAVATVALAIDRAPGTADVRLQITRGGETIVDEAIDWNVDGEPAGPLTAVQIMQARADAYQALPPPGGGAAASAAAAPGTPAYDALKGAVTAVLDADPGVGAYDLAALTPAQALFVANEIAWNRQLHPLPRPDAFPVFPVGQPLLGELTIDPIEAMYTALPFKLDLEAGLKAGGAPEQRRQQFQGDIQAYYALRGAEATRLAAAVAALAAAEACAARSAAADRAVLSYSIRPAGASNDALASDGDVAIGDGVATLANLGFDFSVPAAYFYGLGAALPPQVPAERRYRTAVLGIPEQTAAELRALVAAGTVAEPASGVTLGQAVRRLQALGRALEPAPALAAPNGSPAYALIVSWLAFQGDDAAAWWRGEVPPGPTPDGLLALVATTVSDGFAPLVAALLSGPQAVASVDALGALAPSAWRKLFRDRPELLPSFTKPGTAAERADAFIRRLQRYFDPVADPAAPAFDTDGGPASLSRAAFDPLAQFAIAYAAEIGAPLSFDVALDQEAVAKAAEQVFPEDRDAQGWLALAARRIGALWRVSDVAPAALRFSIVEALYARGFDSAEAIGALDAADFASAIVGSVAYPFAKDIHGLAAAAGGGAGDRGPSGFQPVNPTGLLVDCIPPAHLSPFGATAYLKALLRLSSESSCSDPFPQSRMTLLDLLAPRRGKLDDLLASAANFSTRLPLIDLVNENLEELAAVDPAGAIRQTASDRLAGHPLNPASGGHDPEVLFRVIPEFSSPSAPVAAAEAYERLRADFSRPTLPYSQPLDVVRSALAQLRTTRYAAMRRFRRDITEFVLDPAAEPAEFQRHLWRYPVRIDVAREYLGVAPEEHAALFTTDLASNAADRRPPLRELYGFAAEKSESGAWTEVVLDIPEFLARTGLDYCEFLALWRSNVVPFAPRGRAKAFPACPPCCPERLTITFPGASDPIDPLRRLAVLIRLYRKLNTVAGAAYDFEDLRDIAATLELFDGAGAINSDFIRQLAAFQMLRDVFGLPLRPGAPAPGATGAERSPLLALWAGPGAPGWDWALKSFMRAVERVAERWEPDSRGRPDLIKLGEETLDRLSAVAGFDPSSATDSWRARPTHTLRFAEALAKIAASRFTAGDVLFMFADGHVAGDDPFELQGGGEARTRPLDLPDDDAERSLSALRRALLAVGPDNVDREAWTWPRIEAALRNDFGHQPLDGAPDPLAILAERFFPGVIERAGHAVPRERRQYRVALAGSNALMWNTPSGGPFRYDAGAGELWTELPLAEDAVFAKLSHIRQLKPAEAAAVRDLVFAPRLDLAPFALLFPDFDCAATRMIEEPDEEARFALFRDAVVIAHARAGRVVAHLAAHVVALEPVSRHDDDQRLEEAEALAWHVLRNLLADENAAKTSWEADGGERPDTSYGPSPSGGSFAALLGLVGGGLIAEYADAAGKTVWRTRQNGVRFEAARADWNAPVPTLLPSIDAALTSVGEQLAFVRNGFAAKVSDGAPLGGVAGFRATWHGVLLVEKEGWYAFDAGVPAPNHEDSGPDRHPDWRVAIGQSAKVWLLLERDPDGAEISDHRSGRLYLRPGAYQLDISFEEAAPAFVEPDALCRQRTGFELRYAGPDTGGESIALPPERLYVERKSAPLGDGLALSGVPATLAATLYVPTLRDARRTYQRAFKGLLFAVRSGLSAATLRKDPESEIHFLLRQPEGFLGTSYPRSGAGFSVHRAFFDLNLLPLRDSYLPPEPADDQRSAPSPKRMQALFDVWERIQDYVRTRKESAGARERPLWILFYEALDDQPDDPAHLVRHVGVDARRANLVQRYFDGVTLTSVDLHDERWAVRVWQAEQWLRGVERAFAVDVIAEARPDLWASDDPHVATPGEAESGVANLGRFLREGCFENGEPRRYADVRLLNDGLRMRARDALFAHLCAMERVALPWGGPGGGFATNPRELGEFLLMDVEAGLSQRMSRIEEAITSIQIFVRRARLGLEPSFQPGAAFLALWDGTFASLALWAACRKRRAYPEDAVEAEAFAVARKSEAFRFFEDQLMRGTLTLPRPGGLEFWTAVAPPEHPCIALLQARDRSTIRLLRPAPEGLGLLGTPTAAGAQSWLAPFGIDDGRGREPAPDDGPQRLAVRTTRVEGGGRVARATTPTPVDGPFPLWFEAAVRLGTRFLRVAAASEPPASTRFAAATPDEGSACCCDCDAPVPAEMDEYYFWLVEASLYDATAQNAGWTTENDPDASAWRDPETLPRLLVWSPGKIVHLHWCRVRAGAFGPKRRSGEGVRLTGSATARLELTGRSGDSLTFSVAGGIVELGASTPPPVGFRYDLASDAAVVIPSVAPSPAATAGVPGDLPAYPFFAYFDPGAPIVPQDVFAPAVAVASALRTHCRFEAALAWLALPFAAFESDASWLACPWEDARQGPGRRSAVRAAATPRTAVSGFGPCCPEEDVSEAHARRRAITLRTAQTLVALGAALGRRPGVESSQAARLAFDTLRRLLGERPDRVFDRDDQTPATIADVVLRPAPLNPRLLALYDDADEGLGLVHASLDLGRRLPLVERRGAPLACSPADGCCCDDGGDWCATPSPYRFTFVAQRAQEFAETVTRLGAGLLAAFEKGDAEQLAAMRAAQERQLLDLGLDVRQNQWREADWQVQAMQKSKEHALTRKRNLDNLLAGGLIGGEIAFESLTTVSIGSRTTANVTEAMAQTMQGTPDAWQGVAGFGGTPLAYFQLPIGSKLGGVFATGARILNTVAELTTSNAGLSLTDASWSRREAEWRHQSEITAIEIEQIERQLLAAERRRDVALRELNSHRRQIEHSAETQDHLRDKATGVATYLALQNELAVLHHRTFELARVAALQAQTAFNYEMGYSDRRFVESEPWRDLFEALTAGEGLTLAVQRMNGAYMASNTRTYELSKHVSLRLHDPFALLRLKMTGSCEVELPEWLFDLDYPGHYMRRIRSVALTLPSVVGPYTGVHCRLTLLSSETRISPDLSPAPAHCCAGDGIDDPYRAQPEDARILRHCAISEAIATSSGQNDSGLFELTFRDERYLPFEFKGAVSRWRIDLAQSSNAFDIGALNDVVLHLNYTALPAGEAVAAAAAASAQDRLPGDGWRLFDVDQDLPNAWRGVEERSGRRRRLLELKLARRHFPFLPDRRHVAVNRIELLFASDRAHPGEHQLVLFTPEEELGRRCDEIEIPCFASVETPGFFHGVLKRPFAALRSHEHLLGTFRFDGTETPRSMLLICRYDELPIHARYGDNISQ